MRGVYVCEMGNVKWELLYLHFLIAVRNHRVVLHPVRVQWVEWVAGKRQTVVVRGYVAQMK